MYDWPENCASLCEGWEGFGLVSVRCWLRGRVVVNRGGVMQWYWQRCIVHGNVVSLSRTSP